MSTGLRTFLAERYPFALHALSDSGELDVEKLRHAVDNLPDTTPGVSASERQQQAIDDILAAVDGFRRREAIVSSLTADEKRTILRGMLRWHPQVSAVLHSTT